MKQEQIQHLGTIESINGNTAVVKIQNVSACAGCHAKGACNSADTAEKLVDVSFSPTSTFTIGQLVSLKGDYAMGLKAVLYGYIFPFLLVLLTLIATLASGFNELTGGLVSLAILVPYYAVLYFTKEKFEKTFVFTIQN